MSNDGERARAAVPARLNRGHDRVRARITIGCPSRALLRSTVRPAALYRNASRRQEKTRSIETAEEGWSTKDGATTLAEIRDGIHVLRRPRTLHSRPSIMSRSLVRRRMGRLPVVVREMPHQVRRRLRTDKSSHTGSHGSQCRNERGDKRVMVAASGKIDRQSRDLIAAAASGRRSGCEQWEGREESGRTTQPGSGPDA